MKIAIVVPIHARTEYFLTPDFINALFREAQVGHADVIIVDDSDGAVGALPTNWLVFDYAKQKEFLGDLYEDFARMFHKSSECRVFGHLWAYAEDYDVIIGLDSDCVVRPSFVANHLLALNQPWGCGWTNPISETMHYPRGFPYFMRNWPVVASMGLWDKTLDLNGFDRSPDEPHQVKEKRGVAVAPIPFSGMNFALTRDAVPGFLFVPRFKFENNHFKRIDDIWGGYIFQMLARKRRESVAFGSPIVDHITLVVPEEDIADEEPMYKYEELFFAAVDQSMMDFVADVDTSYIDLLKEFFEKFYLNAPAPFGAMMEGLDWWIKAWKKMGERDGK